MFRILVIWEFYSNPNLSLFAFRSTYVAVIPAQATYCIIASLERRGASSGMHTISFYWYSKLIMYVCMYVLGAGVEIVFEGEHFPAGRMVILTNTDSKTTSGYHI